MFPVGHDLKVGPVVQDKVNGAVFAALDDLIAQGDVHVIRNNFSSSRFFIKLLLYPESYSQEDHGVHLRADPPKSPQQSASSFVWFLLSFLLAH